MATRPFIFRKGAQELILPVTPESFQVERGINVEVVNIHDLGDVIAAGKGTLATVKIACLLPAAIYHFASDAYPEAYLRSFIRWSSSGDVIRFIIGGTDVNMPCVVQSIAHGEQDGTNDVYADITLREYRELKTVQIAISPAESKPRPEPESEGTSVQVYKIVSGDTLSGICRRFYGDGSAAMYNKLAAYNAIKNPNLIYAGKTLQIPKPLI